MIEIQVPARICLYGDHQDYLGLPVIAATVDRYIRLRAVPNQKGVFSLNLPDLGEAFDLELLTDPTRVGEGDFFRSGLAVLQGEGFAFEKGYDIEISGNVPINAGLSSSSALLVAWIRFLVALQGGKPHYSDLQIGQWAYRAEVVFFNSPGGLMDQYTIAQGGLLYIDTQTGESQRLKVPELRLIVAESGLAKRTLEVLKNARVYAQNALEAIRAADPDFELSRARARDWQRYEKYVPQTYRPHWYACIHNYQITLDALEELRSGRPDPKRLGALMNAHQKILQEQIGNTPEDMVRMMEAALKAGALGAKTIGSGGGGCMLALVERGSLSSVGEAFGAAGAKAVYEVGITSW